MWTIESFGSAIPRERFVLATSQMVHARSFLVARGERLTPLSATTRSIKLWGGPFFSFVEVVGQQEWRLWLRS